MEEEELLVHYGLPKEEVRKLLSEVDAALRASGKDEERNMASLMFMLNFEFMESRARMSLEDSLAWIGTVARDREFLARQQRMVDSTPNTLYMLSLPPGAAEWGKGFLKEILRGIRKAICTESAEYSGLKKEYVGYPKAFAVAASSAVLSSLGISSAMALGLATLVLLVLAQATKDAFCRMTDDDVLKSIEEKVAVERKELEERVRKATEPSKSGSGKRKKK
jgi:hypothetical protein